MNKEEIIKMIEARSRSEILNLIRKAGYGPIGYQAGDYSAVKKLIFMKQWIDSDIYDKQIKWICEYLGI